MTRHITVMTADGQRILFHGSSVADPRIGHQYSMRSAKRLRYRGDVAAGGVHRLTIDRRFDSITRPRLIARSIIARRRRRQSSDPQLKVDDALGRRHQLVVNALVGNLDERSEPENRARG
jgi:hypothetical protein